MDGLTPEYKEALRNSKLGHAATWSLETGEFSVEGRSIPRSLLPEMSFLRAQYVGIGNHAENIDLNSRGLGGKSALASGGTHPNRSRQSWNKRADLVKTMGAI